ncbi:MAG: hypothetical protein HRT94_00175 [Alphaproteobacteria bacterium]|nr:hypothetical protein [Alphaproteobacteria bacterium]
MFSKPAVRSRKKIIKGLLSRAFDRGGAAEQEKMQLLIDWRLAACRHSNEKALQEFSSDYKLDDMRNYVSSGSRGIDAFNWLSVIDGRNDFLSDMSDAQRKQKIADMERMHYMVRFFKNSEIQVDLEALRKAATRKDPNAPIMVDPANALSTPCRDRGVVYTKSFETPAYLKPLSEIDAMVDDNDGGGGSGKSAKKERRQTVSFATAPKATFH